MLKDLFFTLLIAIGLICLIRAVQLTDRDYYGFPATTKCRVCDRTVWKWQDHERRSFETDYDFIGFSGIVHAGHPDTPRIKVKVEFETESGNGGK